MLYIDKSMINFVYNCIERIVKGVFQLQTYYRWPSTRLHIYVPTRPTNPLMGIKRRVEPATSRVGFQPLTICRFLSFSGFLKFLVGCALFIGVNFTIVAIFVNKMRKRVNRMRQENNGAEKKGGGA